MDFTKIVGLTDTEARNSLIDTEICAEAWSDHLEDCMTRGGWPDDEIAHFNPDTDIEDTEDEILADVEVCYDEVLPTSCSDCALTFKGSAVFRITIDKATGLHDTECVSYDNSDDDSLHVGDYQ